ncbi:MAG: polymerase protein [Candidatus Woesebacteria bacterium GW2011_GWB1_39_12]|uniref:Polymerase protein n=2 Tax=Candidatus Woeseibacteriota TaxID=1752722 RepID=A0A0G0MD16_9BACT|nr:MAG: polymerase protein [Candidatus Woesebacteria bacterium GW2011_GWA1_39_12]KKR00295.1 MAG: polymerase protein [Candidatus Woesebacteria bacterium GW2011_GWB1_39_12]
MSKLVLIDGNAILHRAYHALPPLTTKRGEPINAVYGLISMLLRVIQDLKPTHIAVCFDRKEPTFRHEAFKEYQAQRPTMDKELSGQFEKAKETITVMNIPIFEKAGYEADDLLGSIAEQGQRAKDKEQRIDETIIVTGDRDILQLVNAKVKVFLPVRGLSEGKLFGVEEVKEKMGVDPNQIIDYKALVGDQSDNYKGVPGIGHKTAIKLIGEYGSFEKIYKNLDSVSKQTKEKLEKGKTDGEISLKLAGIVRDVPLDADFGKMAKWCVDSHEVLDLFADFGFRTLTKRVKEVGKSIVSENQMKLI